MGAAAGSIAAIRPSWMTSRVSRRAPPRPSSATPTAITMRGDCARGPVEKSAMKASSSARRRMRGSYAIDQFLVEDDRVVRSSVRIERIARDRPRGDPSETAVQAFRRFSPLRIQGQQSKAGLARRVLDRLHQRGAQASATPAAMHDQLHDLRAMRLVRRPGRMELDGAYDSFEIASDEKDGARISRGNRPLPPLLGSFERERRQKADRRSGVDRVHEKTRELPKVRVAPRWHQSFNYDTRHEPLHTADCLPPTPYRLSYCLRDEGGTMPLRR